MVRGLGRISDSKQHSDSLSSSIEEGDEGCGCEGEEDGGTNEDEVEEEEGGVIATSGADDERRTFDFS